MSRIVKLGLATLAAFAVLGAGTAWAQSASIVGVARDSSGAVMPGVTVEASSPALIEKSRTAITDGEGQYKIINLQAGVYDVTFTLSGFSTVKKTGIELTATFTAQVNGDLKVSAVSETITVSGQSPLVDTQTVTQKKALTADVIDALPTGRSFQNLSVLVPGVTLGLGTQDVGGTQGDRYQTLTVHGSRSDQMPLIMNGMPYNNMNNTGGGYNTTLVINTGTVQEMTVTTSGLTAEQRSSGVLTNIIPKEGSNKFHGQFFANFANSSMQSNNLTDDLIARNLKSVPTVKKLDDVNPVAGGPIIQDKLWWFGGFRVDQAQSYQANAFVNLRPTAAQVLRAGSRLDDVQLRRREPSDDARSGFARPEQSDGRRRHVEPGRDRELHVSGVAEEQGHRVRALQPAPRGLQRMQLGCVARSRHLLHAPPGVPASVNVDQSTHEQDAPRGRLHLLQRTVDFRA